LFNPFFFFILVLTLKISLSCFFRPQRFCPFFVFSALGLSFIFPHVPVEFVSLPTLIATFDFFFHSPPPPRAALSCHHLPPCRGCFPFPPGDGPCCPSFTPRSPPLSGSPLLTTPFLNAPNTPSRCSLPGSFLVLGLFFGGWRSNPPSHPPRAPTILLRLHFVRHHLLVPPPPPPPILSSCFFSAVPDPVVYPGLVLLSYLFFFFFFVDLNFRYFFAFVFFFSACCLVVNRCPCLLLVCVVCLVDLIKAVICFHVSLCPP